MSESAAQHLPRLWRSRALPLAWALSGWIACASGPQLPGAGMDALAPAAAGGAACPVSALTPLPDVRDIRAELSLVDCLLLGRRLDEAASRLAAIVESMDGDDPLKGEVSERLMRLLRTPGRLSGLPARLRLADSSIPVPSLEARVAGRVGRMVVDSGAEVTILRESVCSELGLERGAGGVAENAGGEIVGGIYTARLPYDLVLGSVTLDLPVVACADLENFAELEPRLLGVLGGNALGASSYQLSMARGELVLGAPLPPGLVRLDADFQDGRVLVTADVDGRPVRFLLDTGADVGTFSPSTRQELGLSARSDGEPRTTYVFGGEREESGARISVALLRSGDERREDVEFRVGVENRLGIDFLGDRTLVVDRAAGIVGLSPVP